MPNLALPNGTCRRFANGSLHISTADAEFHIPPQGVALFREWLNETEASLPELQQRVADEIMANKADADAAYLAEQLALREV